MMILIKASLLLFLSTMSAHNKLYKGFKGYVSITILSPGQLRYTVQNVQTKAKKLQQTHSCFDDGRSSLNSANPIPVILGPDDLVIVVDNHHEYLAAESLGDQTIPIEVKDDLSTLTREKFYSTAKLKNYIYPYDKMGNEVPLPKKGWHNWYQLKDDPNRLFASLTAWKRTGTECTKDPNASETPINPLWVKDLNRKFESAFIEFKIATVLYQAGLCYDYSWGLNPNSEELTEFTERARLVLDETLQRGALFSLELIKSQNSRKKYTISE